MRCTTTASSSLSVHALEREWQSTGVLTYRDARDAHEYRRLLRQLEDGRISRVAFVKPDGASWPLPLYELSFAAAAAAAAACDAGGVEVQLRLVTPESRLLTVRGGRQRGRPCAVSTNTTCACTRAATECRADRDGCTSRRATAASVSTALSL